jgi:transposase InsO family protein
VKYAWINENKLDWPIAIMCPLLKVCKSAYYAHRQRSLTQAAKERLVKEQTLKTAISEQSKLHKRRYGRTRMTAALNALGHTVNHKRVGALMKQMDVQCNLRRKYKICTTDSKHSYTITPNTLARQFEQTAPNTAWVADITYIHTREGWMYAALVMDWFSRKIVGWAINDTMAQSLTLEALRAAIVWRSPQQGLLHHSDRGSQYCAHDYRDLQAVCGFVSSMSRKGNCWDNAAMESANGSLKVECVNRTVYDTKAQAKQEAIEYIGYYNNDRIHTSLGNLTPVQFENRWYEAQNQTALPVKNENEVTALVC